MRSLQRCYDDHYLALIVYQSRVTASGLKMLIGLEGAHAFCVSIFGGDEHLPGSLWSQE